MNRNHLPAAICLWMVCIAGCGAARTAANGGGAANQIADDTISRIKTSVVGVTAYQTVPQGLYVRTRDFVNPFPLRSFITDTIRFTFYFPRIIIYPFPSQRFGSGFLIDDEGHVITSNHIVEDFNVFYVRLFDGSQYEVQLTGKDPLADIALLKLDTTDLPPALLRPAILGDSDAVRVGDPIMAIGDALGLRQTVTLGIVSGIGRQIGVTFTEDLIQVDTALNPGNSGGPLFNADGEVVAVAEAMIWLAENKGFAVPVNMITNVLDDLKAGREPSRGCIGITARGLTYREATLFGLESPAGAFVVSVENGSPADHCGLHEGDVIAEVDRRPIAGVLQLARAVRSTQPGTNVTLSVMRAVETADSDGSDIEKISIEVAPEVIRKPFRLF